MTESPFEACAYEFRIQEFHLVSKVWMYYAAYRDGRTARDECDSLNSDYAAYGRTFRVQRRPLGAWKAIYGAGVVDA